MKDRDFSPTTFCGRIIEPKELEKALLNQEEFHPFPKIDERKKWDSLPTELRQRLIRQGERYLDFEWPTLPLSSYLEFQRNGNRSRYEKAFFNRRFVLANLAIAECVENKGRFLDQIMNGLWVICEETSWVVPAHLSAQKTNKYIPNVNEPIIDLFASETASTLAWVSYLLKTRFDSTSPLINERIESEIKHRVLDPYLERNDFHWFGFHGESSNNWMTWCNSNCLAAFLLMENDQNRRVMAVEKGLRSLGIFLQQYPLDGGCDEGSHYWNVAGGRLLDSLELVNQASNGTINFFDQELIQRIGQYIYRVHIHDGYFVNFADGSATPPVNPDLIYRYGRRIEDKRLVDLALAIFPLNKEFRDQTINSTFQRLNFIFDYETLETHPDTEFPYVCDVWLGNIQVMAAREVEGDYKGFYLAAKGGHNAETHNHNDVGNFVVYYDGKPLIIDVGVERYTRQMFGPNRYEIWTMQSQYHNLPIVNSFGQQAGKEHKADNVTYTAGDERAVFSMELASAYPSKAGVKTLHRECKLNRDNGGSIDICDTFELQQATQDIMWTLMTPCEHKIDNSAGILMLKLGKKTIAVTFDPSLYSGQSEKIATTDEWLLPVWGDHVYRILFKAKTSIQKGEWKIHIDDKH